MTPFGERGEIETISYRFIIARCDRGHSWIGDPSELLTRALESSGMDTQAAERVATEIYDAIHDNVASKTDVAAIRADIAAVRGEMREMEQRIIIRLGSMVVLGTGILIAIKYFG